jgi:hypothetical protein
METAWTGPGKSSSFVKTNYLEYLQLPERLSRLKLSAAMKRFFDGNIFFILYL